MTIKQTFLKLIDTADALPYIPIVREARGVINITAGIISYVAGKAFEYSSNPDLVERSTGHMKRGGKRIKQGLLDIAPMVAVCATTLIYRNWTLINSSNSSSQSL